MPTLNIGEDLLVGILLAMAVTIATIVIAFFGLAEKAITPFMAASMVTLVATLAFIGVGIYGIMSKWANDKKPAAS